MDNDESTAAALDEFAALYGVDEQPETVETNQRFINTSQDKKSNRSQKEDNRSKPSQRGNQLHN